MRVQDAISILKRMPTKSMLVPGGMISKKRCCTGMAFSGCPVERIAMVPSPFIR